ncbi:MAG: glycoside hydrolase family 2 TIM barrel-domain containing protein [Lutimonas sp.]
MYKTLFFSILSFFSLFSSAQKNLLQNVFNRNTTSLNGEWNYIVDPYENGYYNYRLEAFDLQADPSRNAYFTNSKPVDKTELIEYDFDRSETILIPGDWNTQKENLFYYEGSVWFKKSFNYIKQHADHRVFIYFGAVNYQSDVYLNGKKLGRHIGGFTPFNFEITDFVKEKENFVVIKVDNKRLKEGVPTLNTDWWNYGGMTRDIKIVEVPNTFIDDYLIQLDPQNNQLIKGFIQLSGTDIKERKVLVTIPDLKINKELTTDENGLATIEIPVKKMQYWSNLDPFLYDVTISFNKDQIHDKIGFRTIKTEGKDILINGQPIFLKGISIHEESPFTKGRGNSEKDARQLLDWAKELGCNYIRLAHYPHNEHMVRVADELGILVWEENPVYWTIDWTNPETLKNAKNQLTELINRDKNRASVIIWSMANETPQSTERLTFLTQLATQARKLDPTRLISAALEQSPYLGNPEIRTIDDPFAEVVDILSFNQYVGWYDGLPEKCKTITWKIEQNKPVLISEFGAGAKFGLHGDKNERWTEEYQAYLYEETLQMLDKVDQFRGTSPWILVDFRSPRRPLPKIQDGYNRKGLISENGEKKKAFYVLQKYYNNKKY